MRAHVCPGRAGSLCRADAAPSAGREQRQLRPLSQELRCGGGAASPFSQHRGKRHVTLLVVQGILDNQTISCLKVKPLLAFLWSNFLVSLGPFVLQHCCLLKLQLPQQDHLRSGYLYLRRLFLPIHFLICLLQGADISLLWELRARMMAKL